MSRLLPAGTRRSHRLGDRHLRGDRGARNAANAGEICAVDRRYPAGIGVSRRSRRAGARRPSRKRRSKRGASVPACRSSCSTRRSRCRRRTASVTASDSTPSRPKMQMSELFEDFIDRVPLGRTFFADRNPVRTAGPMQVSVAFAGELERPGRIRIRCPDPCARKCSRAAAACISASRICSIIARRTIGTCIGSPITMRAAMRAATRHSRAR